MGVSRHHHHHHHRHTVVAFTFLLFASASVITLSQLGSGSGFQEREGGRKRSGSVFLDWFLAQKQLRGPGSSPPSCRSKCGSCSPCKPVHVPIQPAGLSMPLQYYPEAWRCECGNKLFVP